MLNTRKTKKKTSIVMLMIIALAFIMLISSMTNPAGAESSSAIPDAGYGQNTFYIYAKAGERIYADFTKYSSEAAASTSGRELNATIYHPNGVGYKAAVIKATSANGTKTFLVSDSPNNTASQTGIYTIELKYSAGSGGISYNWNIGVKSATGTAIPGRVWVEQYFNHIVANDLRNANFYAMNNTGHIYNVKLHNFNGWYSTYRFDAMGVANPGCTSSAYASYSFAAGENPNGLTRHCGTPYRIFFAQPANDLPAKALSKNGEKWVKPALVDMSRVVDGNITFTPSRSSGMGGEFTVPFLAQYNGNYRLDIITSSTAITPNWNGTITRSINGSTQGGITKVQWDGRENAANGGKVVKGPYVYARVFIEKYGEFHFTLDDMEALGGITITALNGIASGRNPSLINWNDSNLLGTGRIASASPVTGTNVNSAANTTTRGTYRGTAKVGTWSDNAFIDTWTFVAENYTAKTATFTPPNTKIPNVVNGSIEVLNTGPFKVGDIINYRVTYKNMSGVTLYMGGSELKVNNKIIPSESKHVEQIPPKATLYFDHEYKVTQNDMDAAGNGSGNIEAYSTLWGTDIDASIVPDEYDTNTVSVPLVSASPSIDVTKTLHSYVDVNNNGIVDVGDRVRWNIVAKNTGNVTLQPVQVIDSKLDTAGVSYVKNVSSLAPGASSTDLTGWYTITQADANSGKLVNQVQVRGSSPSGAIINSTAVYDSSVPGNSGGVTLPDVANPNPKLSISKTATEPTRIIRNETSITWRYRITNTGNVPVSGFTVTDSKGVTVTCPTTTLAVGASTNCTGTGIIK